MKRRSSLVHWLAVTFLLACAHGVRGQNLLVNGSFEQGSAPWTISSLYATTTNAAAIAADGSVALVLPLFDTNNPAPATVSQTFDTVPGQEYVLRFFYNTRESGQGRIFAGGAELASLRLDGAAAEEGWGYARRSFVADAAKTTLRLEVRLDAPGLMSFDAFEVVQSPSPDPTSVVQFQSGALTLAEGSISPIEIRRDGALDQAAFATLEYDPAVLSPAEPALDFNLLRSVAGAPSFNPRRIGVYFPAGAATCVLGLKALRDTVVEGDEKGFLRLVATGNANIGSQSELSVTVADREASGRVVLTPPPAVYESAGLITVRLQLLDGFCGSIRAHTVDGGTATTGLDYIAVDHTWPATNANELTIDVPILQDGLAEDGMELILMKFESLDGRTELNLEQIGLWIIDLDGFDLGLVNSSVQDGPNQGEFTFSRSRADAPLSLDVATRDGTAKAGIDFQATRTRLTFPAGESLSTVRIPIIDRPGSQGWRVFYLDLTNATQHLRVSSLPISIEDWPSPRPGPFRKGQDIPTGRAPSTLRAADMNSDGALDLVVASRLDHSMSVLTAHNGSFVPVASESTSSGLGPTSVIVADFNRDGFLDAATVNREANSFQIFSGNGKGNLRAGEPIALPAGAGPVSIASADFNRDGSPDVVVANGSSNNFMVFLGDGIGGFLATPRAVLMAEGSPQEVVTGDFNNDGNPDVAAGHSTTDSNFVSVFFGNGLGEFERVPGSPYHIGGGPASLAVADLDGDGLQDISCLDSLSVMATYLLSRGVGFEQVQYNLPGLESFPQAIAILDANADGVPDLAVASNGTVPETSGIYVVAGARSPRFFLEDRASSIFLPVRGRIAAIVAADLNGDGKTDLAAAREDSGLRVFYNTHGETNGPAQVVVLPSDPVTESSGQAMVFFRRNSHLDEEQSFFLKTAPGTAQPGIHYVNTEERLVFHPGEVEVSAAIPLMDDDWYAGNRSLLLELSDPSPGLELPNDAGIALRDDDAPVLISLGNGGGMFETAGETILTINRSGSLESDRVVKVQYEITAGDPPSAIPGVDFDPVRGILEFGKGVTERTIVLPILNDDRVDGTRNLRLVITNLANFEMGSFEQQFSVLDDERAFLEHTIPWSHFGARGTHELTAASGNRIFAVSSRNGRSAVVAVTATGSLDRTYGTDGHAFLPGGIPDSLRAITGGRIGVNMHSGDSNQLVILDPSGQIEANHSTLEPFLQSEIFGPLSDGKFIAVDSAVRRLLPDGSVDPTYIMHMVSLDKWPGPFAVDALGRVYFQTYGGKFTDIPIGAFARLGLDGELDLEYRPFPTALDVAAWDVRADSTAVIYSWNPVQGTTLFRVSPDGIPTVVASDIYNVQSVELLVNDWIYLTGGWCGWGHCSYWGTLIAPDGRRFEGPSSNPLDRRFVTFHGMSLFKTTPDSVTFGSPLDGPAVGWAQGEIFAVNSNPAAELQRAGPTTDGLGVLCQIRAASSTDGTPELVTRTVQFEKYHCGARLDLSFLRSDSADRVRQFDISIVDANGLEVPFPTTRLIIVPDPPQSGLAVQRMERPGYPATLLLIADASFPNDAFIERSTNLNEWERITYGAPGSEYFPLIQEISPEQDPAFYRVSRGGNR